LEEYSAHHSETVEVLLEWPALRFERFYEAYMKRQVSEELTQRKLMMINALYSNSNYDGENSKIRDQVIERLEDQFTAAIRAMYAGKTDSSEEEIDKNNPFFGAMERGLERQGVPKLEEMEDVEVERSDNGNPLDDLDIDQM
jgi:hypothetical protein